MTTYTETRKTWYHANKDKINARRRAKYAATNPKPKLTKEERKERQQQRDAEWFQKNKTRKYEVKKKAIKEKKAWIWAYKEERGCIKCGFNHPAALDFHHPGGVEKDFAIGAATNHNYGLARIKQEVEKCEVMCRNCHALHHWELDQAK